MGEERLIGQVETGPREAMALDIYTTLPLKLVANFYIKDYQQVSYLD